MEGVEGMSVNEFKGTLKGTVLANQETVPGYFLFAVALVVFCHSL